MADGSDVEEVWIRLLKLSCVSIGPDPEIKKFGPLYDFSTHRSLCEFSGQKPGIHGLRFEFGYLPRWPCSTVSMLNASPMPPLLAIGMPRLPGKVLPCESGGSRGTPQLSSVSETNTLKSKTSSDLHFGKKRCAQYPVSPLVWG